jgi:predicted transcriptional regulator
MIQNLPENCTFEDIQYHLYVIEKIQKGLERAGEGKTVTHKNAKERMKKWLPN